MVTVVLKDCGVFTAKNVVQNVIGTAQVTGITVQQMRSRVKILDALEKASDKLELDDAQFELLKREVENFPFRVAHADLLAVIDALIAPIHA